MSTSPKPHEPVEHGSGTRTAISLILVIHLFLIFVSVTAVMEASPAQNRLLTVFRFYTDAFNFDLRSRNFQLTHNSMLDADHSIEVLPEGSRDEWKSLPDVGWRGSERHRRYQRLAVLLRQYAENEQASADISHSIASHFVHREDIKPKELRCRWLVPQGWLSLTTDADDETETGPPDPYDAAYYNVAYGADILVSKTGGVDIVKQKSAGQVAQPGAASNSAAGANGAAGSSGATGRPTSAADRERP